MQLRFFFSSLFILVISCMPANTDENNTQRKVVFEPEEIIETHLSNNKSWSDNSITKDQFQDTLTQLITPLIKDGIYDSLPFKFIEIAEFVEAGKKGYLALFNFDHEQFKSERWANKMKFSIYGIVPDSLIGKLIEEQSYLIQGNILQVKDGKVNIMNSVRDRKNIDDIYLPSVRMKISNVIPFYAIKH